MRSILAIMAIESVAPDVRTVAEVNNPRHEPHFQRADVDEVLVTSKLASQLLARSALYPGLSALVTDIVSGGEGSELYRVAIPEYIGLSVDGVAGCAATTGDAAAVTGRSRVREPAIRLQPQAGDDARRGRLGHWRRSVHDRAPARTAAVVPTCLRRGSGRHPRRASLARARTRVRRPPMRPPGAWRSPSRRPDLVTPVATTRSARFVARSRSYRPRCLGLRQVWPSGRLEDSARGPQASGPVASRRVRSASASLRPPAAPGYSALTAAVRAARPSFASAKSIPVFGSA